VGEIRRDQRRVLQEKRRLIDSRCALEIEGGAELRLLDDGDTAELHALIEANRERLAEWLPWAAAQTLADTGEFIARTRKQAAGNDGFQAAIIRGGRIAGVVGFISVDWSHRTTGLGYWLGEEFSGQGTMIAAVRAMTDHALHAWELNRVEIGAATENRRSRAIPERLGYREEGTVRQAQRVGDRYLDLVVYGMLAQDWTV
jgi:ribosomal-protein-serine acetyltransferase